MEEVVVAQQRVGCLLCPVVLRDFHHAAET